jgi:hypothetical protein
VRTLNLVASNGRFPAPSALEDALCLIDICAARLLAKIVLGTQCRYVFRQSPQAKSYLTFFSYFTPTILDEVDHADLPNHRLHFKLPQPQTVQLEIPLHIRERLPSVDHDF